MSHSFYPIRCNDFEDFVAKVGEHTQKPEPGRGDKPQSKTDHWIFRGQQEAQWDLRTSLERVYERFGVEGNDRLTVERRMIREFQRRLHHYTSDVPDERSLDEWMALMQHHGAPTRLLDFTYSPYVAAYFAFEKAERKSAVAIWAVNTDWLERHLKCRFDNLYEPYLSYQARREAQAFNTVFMCARRKLVLSVNPFRLNDRLTYQRGVFLCPGDITVGFMDNLSDFMDEKGPDQKVIQFTIPAGYEGEVGNCALERLDQMNISRITLFPGLDGFAQSFPPKTRFFLNQRWP